MKNNSPSGVKQVSFDSFNLNADGPACAGRVVETHFSWDDTYHFVHKLKIPVASHNNLTRENWEVYAFHLGLARFPYYFAPVWPERVIIKAGSLNPDQLAQWKSWYVNGLAEFLYKNDLPFDINLSVEKSHASAGRTHHLRFKASEKSLADKYIVLNGGGKDSAVSGEVLKSMDIPFSWLTLGMNPAQRKVIEISKNINHIKVGGRADKYRKELKRKFGLYKGHQPLSLYLSFVAAMAAEVNGSHYIIASNEKSANHENLTHNGVKVNHQYTKSFQFESELNNYIKLYLNPQLSYFSLLRPLYEVQILKIFSKFEQYHGSFISCNNSIHEGSWCGRCSKCAFVYLALYSFLGSNKIDHIIGKNMLDDMNMLPRYLSLTGVEGHKPFECVGTVEENMAAMYLASLIPHPPAVVKHFIENVPELAKGKALVPKILNNYDEVNLIPTHLKEEVKKVLSGLLND